MVYQSIGNNYDDLKPICHDARSVRYTGMVLYNGVFSNGQPGRLLGEFDNRYAWVQIPTPECQEPVQMKLKIQIEPIESIQMEPI